MTCDVQNISSNRRDNILYSLLSLISLTDYKHII